MADPGRLDELKRKVEENPKRYFAALANEYRKAGDPELAIELCRTYLTQQPTHMSGCIVYGQALHDAGHTAESAAVFEQALTIDPENLIALRDLGDISRDAGDKVAAIRWYDKVLELDPRNEEIAAYVTSLANAGSEAPPEELGESDAEHAPAPAVAPAAPAVAPNQGESPFVTATMAELYMQQGLRGEALGIYRQLALKRDDPTLRQRIAEIESDQPAQAAGETVRAFFARIGARRPNERVQFAADRDSALSALFEFAEPDAGDLSAAQRVSGAFGSSRSSDSHS